MGLGTVVREGGREVGREVGRVGDVVKGIGMRRVGGGGGCGVGYLCSKWLINIL